MNPIVGGLLIVAAVVVAGVVYYIASDWKNIVRTQKLRQSGVESVAWAVMVDKTIRKKAEDEFDLGGVAGVLIAADQRDETDADFMLGLGDKLEALCDEKQTDPELKALRREVRDNTYRNGVWCRLPDAWTEGAEVYYTMMEIFRDDLPKKRLTRRYVRCLVDFDRPELGVRHQKYHNKDDDDGPYRPRKSRRD
jgi:hypothetical protein